MIYTYKLVRGIKVWSFNQIIYYFQVTVMVRRIHFLFIIWIKIIIIHHSSFIIHQSLPILPDNFVFQSKSGRFFRECSNTRFPSPEFSQYPHREEQLDWEGKGGFGLYLWRFEKNELCFDYMLWIRKDIKNVNNNSV